MQAVRDEMLVQRRCLMSLLMTFFTGNLFQVLSTQCCIAKRKLFVVRFIIIFELQDKLIHIKNQRSVLIVYALQTLLTLT